MANGSKPNETEKVLLAHLKKLRTSIDLSIECYFQLIEGYAAANPHGVFHPNPTPQKKDGKRLPDDLLCCQNCDYYAQIYYSQHPGTSLQTAKQNCYIASNCGDCPQDDQDNESKPASKSEAGTAGGQH